MHTNRDNFNEDIFLVGVEYCTPEFDNNESREIVYSSAAVANDEVYFWLGCNELNMIQSAACGMSDARLSGDMLA